MTTADELAEQVRLIEATLATLPEDGSSGVDLRTRARLEGYVAGVREGLAVHVEERLIQK
ncbi:hypothetical protein [Cellulosimicrobium sp. KWT-B]|uniref:hypothetical protein n=1 Tax=Cellulosimicrobium sp. KWT-B TaxID=1981152 RepID=UPI000A320451|nr:hypothetical protein [Cellulosimicrobium sp. KWT-B]